MSLLSRIQDSLKAFRQDITENNLTTALYNLLRPGQIIMMADDPRAYIEQGYCKNPNLATVVDLRSSNAASIDVDLFEIDANGDEELLTEHEILDILAQPNEFTSYKDFIELQVKFDLLTGNTYFYSPRPENGNNALRIPQDDKGNYQLYSIHPEEVSIISGGPFNPIAGYKIHGTWGLKLEKSDVLHLRRGNTSSDGPQRLFGESPAKTIRSTLAISNMANTAQFANFKNGGVSGILSFKGASGREEEAAKLKSDWSAEGEGATKIGKLLATSAEVDYHDLSKSNVDLGVLESEMQSLRKIAAHFQIDPGLVGDPAGSTFSNRKDARKAAYTDAYIPSLERILQGFNKWLCPPYAMEGKRLELRPRISNIPEMQPDKKEQWGWLNLAGGNLTPNEKRVIAGHELSKDPLMDLNYFPANLFPLSEDDFTDDEVAKFLNERNIRDIQDGKQ